MVATDWLVLLLVSAVSTWLAWGRHPVVAVVVIVASLTVSAALFLPGPEVRALFGQPAVSLAESLARRTPWTVGQLGHVVGFAGFTMLLWWLRPDLRVWRLLLVLLALAVGAEAMQMLTPSREARLGDVYANLIGIGAGLAFAVPLTALWARHRRRGRRPRR